MGVTDDRVERTDRLEKVRRRRVAEAKRYKEAGVSVMSIAMRMMVPESTVRAYLKQSNE